MPQLMAGRPGEPGLPAGAVEDLIQPLSRQRHATARSLEYHEHYVRARTGGTFCLEVGADLGEEPRRDGDQPLVAAQSRTSGSSSKSYRHRILLLTLGQITRHSARRSRSRHDLTGLPMQGARLERLAAA